ncbi:MAG: hypothetical protein EOO53_17905 [Gammaproteobacteria bacterium]|nr:MAG: hypothetical protein EOO53_17905 [Gammaproteobacteria bacterium]
MNKRTDATLNLNFLNNYVLEDEIYLRMDKLQALCAAQIVLDASDTATARYVRTHYSMVIEEQVTELRNLLNQLFP